MIVVDGLRNVEVIIHWWTRRGGRGHGSAGEGGDSHYKESTKESHTVCPFFLFFGVQADSVFFPEWERGGAEEWRGEEQRGSGGGTKERHRKRSHLCEASTQAGPHLCALLLAGVSLQKLAGLPLSVCYLFVVDSWSCCLFIIRPPHCEDAASVRHSINNPESSHAIQQPRCPLCPTRNTTGIYFSLF